MGWEGWGLELVVVVAASVAVAGMMEVVGLD